MDNKKIYIQDVDMLQITEGREISPENGKKICEFAEKHNCFFGGKEVIESEPLYDIN